MTSEPTALSYECARRARGRMSQHELRRCRLFIPWQRRLENQSFLTSRLEIKKVISNTAAIAMLKRLLPVGRVYHGDIKVSRVALKTAAERCANSRVVGYPGVVQIETCESLLISVQLAFARQGAKEQGPRKVPTFTKWNTAFMTGVPFANPARCNT